MKRNKFSKALKHLKSTELDERIHCLDETISNKIGGVYALNQPGFRLGEKDPARVFYPDIDGNWPAGIPGTPGERTYTRPPGYWDSGPGSVPAVDWDETFTADLSHSGTSTDGFIDASTGTVLVALPPGGSSFILGPLVDGYVYNHGYDDYTNIGYIQKDTRQFVLLGRVQGYWKSGISGLANFNTARQWNGTSGQFTAINPSFTLEMAEWFRDEYNSNRFVRNVSYYYSGGYPQSGNPDPDAPSGSRGGSVPGVGNGGDVGSSGAIPHGRGNGSNVNIGTPQDPPNHGGPDPNLPPWSANPNRKRYEIAGSLSGPRLMDTSDPIRPSPSGPYTPMKDYGSPGKPNLMPSGPSRDPWGGRGPLGPMPGASRGSSSTSMVASYKPQGQVLTENRQKILREVKKPVVIPEQPKQKLQKYKPNFAGKYTPQNTPDVTACKQTDEGVKVQNAAGQTWRTKDRHWSRYQSTERMNVIYDGIGHGDQYWDTIVNENQNKKKQRDRKIQEYFNIVAHEKVMMIENPNYVSPFKQNIEEQETLNAPKDPLISRIKNKLVTQIDYPDKPSPMGYPDGPTPEQINGWHPEYGKRANYYNALDPQSAEAMPPTGNPEIDVKVQKARRIKKILGKKA